MSDTKSDNALLALNLKVVRQMLDLTQAEFGKQVGRSRQAVIAWEDPDSSAKPDEEMLATIAGLIDVTPKLLRYGRLGSESSQEAIDDLRYKSSWDFPARLEAFALDFEQEAAASDPDFRRYASRALRDPALVAMFAGQITNNPTPIDLQRDQYNALIEGLRAMMKLRRAAKTSKAYPVDAALVQPARVAESAPKKKSK
jgi:DNA-binding XRE family transcriptional regulator